MCAHAHVAWNALYSLRVKNNKRAIRTWIDILLCHDYYLARCWWLREGAERWAGNLFRVDEEVWGCVCDIREGRGGRGHLGRRTVLPVDLFLSFFVCCRFWRLGLDFHARPEWRLCLDKSVLLGIFFWRRIDLSAHGSWELVFSWSVEIVVLLEIRFTKISSMELKVGVRSPWLRPVLFRLFSFRRDSNRSTSASGPRRLENPAKEPGSTYKLLSVVLKFSNIPNLFVWIRFIHSFVRSLWFQIWKKSAYFFEEIFSNESNWHFLHKVWVWLLCGIRVLDTFLQRRVDEVFTHLVWISELQKCT